MSNQLLPYIHPNAKIGKDVVISPFSYIYGDVEIGDGTWIGPNVTIMDGARIGKNCKIFPGAVISAEPQDLKYQGEITTVEIGDNTVIRECVTIHKGTTDKMKTVVGSDCLIMGYVHIAHDCFVGKGCILANFAALSGHCIIEDYVPPYVKAAREPISYMGVNAIGLRRRGYSEEVVNNIQNIYRVLFQRGTNISQAIDIICQEFAESPELTEIIEFVKASDKGIINRG